MKSNFVSNVLKGMKNVTYKHGATGLAIIAGLGVIAAAILAAKARPVADEKIQRAKEEKAQRVAEETGEMPDFDHTELTVVEKVKAALPAYVKVIAVVGVTIICIVGSRVVAIKQLGELAAAYNITQAVNDRWEKYSDKVKEEIGEEKSEDLRHAANAESAREMAMNSGILYACNAIQTGKGNELILDAWSGRLYYTSRAAIREGLASANINASNGSGWCVLNDVYDALDWDNTKAGENLVFDMEYGAIEPVFNNNGECTVDGLPYLTFDFSVEPRSKRPTDW